MSKESTNVELEPIEIVGGETISDLKKKIEIPPKGQLRIESNKNNRDIVEIKLAKNGEKEKKALIEKGILNENLNKEDDDINRS